MRIGALVLRFQGSQVVCRTCRSLPRRRAAPVDDASKTGILRNVQVGGRLLRWQLFHHVHVLSRAVKRMPACANLDTVEEAPGAPGWHVLNRHVGWALPRLLQLTRCLHSVWSPQARAAPLLLAAARCQPVPVSCYPYNSADITEFS